jgi:hypothetical protein
MRTRARCQRDLKLRGDEQGRGEEGIAVTGVAQPSENATKDRHVVTVNPAAIAVISRSADSGDPKDQPVG